MKIFTSKSGLGSYLSLKKSGGNTTVGFVPTMGALHTGHISLVKTALDRCDIVVCSVFVNPTQFNDPADLKKYPRPIKADIAKLEVVGCHILFAPEVEEMYNKNEKWDFDLGVIEHILEGKHRPGHYRGVTQIVKKLFDIINPHIAFFGQKDFQQFKVIENLIERYELPVKLVMCETVRDSSGLALSSRNVYLSEVERNQALILSTVLNKTKENFRQKTIIQLKEEAIEFLNQAENFRLEYFEICNSDTLLPALTETEPGIVALVAAYVGDTRLIDNLILR